jgi:hypothetical protein
VLKTYFNSKKSQINQEKEESPEFKFKETKGQKTQYGGHPNFVIAKY